MIIYINFLFSLIIIQDPLKYVHYMFGSIMTFFLNLSFLYCLISPQLLFFSQHELMVKTCAEIVNELVTATVTGKDVNLNGLKNRVARRNKLQNLPKLVDIIAAIPDQHRAALLPKLKAKPIRTASGVCIYFSFFFPVYSIMLICVPNFVFYVYIDCCCSCHV